MNILILVNCYAPENISGCVLVTELATDLQKHGHQVTVITGAPNYPYGQVYKGYHNQIYSMEVLEGVRVIRIWSYISPKRTFWRRILNYGTYSLSAFYGGMAAGKPDILISYSPPLPLGLTAWALSRLWNIPWILQIEDLYPEAAIAAGFIKNRWIIRFFSAMANFFYKKASHVSLICESFRQNLIYQGVSPEKISMIPVWADSNSIFPLSKSSNQFRSQNHLDDKFIILYAGNMGHTSCLEDVVLAAEALKQHPEIQFVLVGEGIKKTELEHSAREKALTNIIFLPYQARNNYSEMLAAADISLVTINSKSGQSSLPSKVFNIMASARPVLAIAESHSDLADLVEKSCIGFVVAPGQPDRLAQAILDSKEHEILLAKMGENGRSLLENRYSRKVCVLQLEQLFTDLAKTKNI